MFGGRGRFDMNHPTVWDWVFGAGMVVGMVGLLGKLAWRVYLYHLKQSRGPEKP